MEELRKAGYPRRHVAALNKMWGESKEKAQAFWGRVRGGDCLLVLCGDRGPGKTQMATYWAACLRTKTRGGKGYVGRYHKAHNLLETIREKYSNDSKTADAARALIKQLKSCSYLVIDEFSELAGTEWEMRTLTDIIDHRYDNMKATVIITNVAREKVEDSLGRSVASRAQETGGIINCNWPSYRGRQNPNNPTNQTH